MWGTNTEQEEIIFTAEKSETCHGLQRNLGLHNTIPWGGVHKTLRPESQPLVWESAGGRVAGGDFARYPQVLSDSDVQLPFQITVLGNGFSSGIISEHPTGRTKGILID